MNANLIRLLERVRMQPVGTDPEQEQRTELAYEIDRARAEWQCAQRRLDWVVDRDQIDYAIYALEAAEKKYEMLLRLAKQFTWDNRPIQRKAVTLEKGTAFYKEGS